MSPREEQERYTRVVAALRAEGYIVTESNQPHRGGTLYDARITRYDVSAEEEHALLAAAIRAGASYSRQAHGERGNIVDVSEQWTDPAAEREVAHA